MANKRAAEIKVETFADYQIITQPNPLRKLVRRVDDKDPDDPVARAERLLPLYPVNSKAGCWRNASA